VRAASVLTECHSAPIPQLGPVAWANAGAASGGFRVCGPLIVTPACQQRPGLGPGRCPRAVGEAMGPGRTERPGQGAPAGQLLPAQGPGSPVARDLKLGDQSPARGRCPRDGRVDCSGPAGLRRASSTEH
jgi:hypothetical protein